MPRQKIEIDWKQFEGYCAIQCTLREIADYFNCSEMTIERKVKEHYNCGFVDIFKRKRQKGLMSLRANLFEMSKKQPSVLIFLAKNWLGMSDKQEIEHSGSQDKPIIIKGVDGETRKLLGEVMNGEGTEGGDTNNPSI